VAIGEAPGEEPPEAFAFDEVPPTVETGIEVAFMPLMVLLLLLLPAMEEPDGEGERVVGEPPESKVDAGGANPKNPSAGSIPAAIWVRFVEVGATVAAGTADRSGGRRVERRFIIQSSKAMGLWNCLAISSMRFLRMVEGARMDVSGWR